MHKICCGYFVIIISQSFCLSIWYIYIYASIFQLMWSQQLSVNHMHDSGNLLWYFPTNFPNDNINHSHGYYCCPWNLITDGTSPLLFLLHIILILEWGWTFMVNRHLHIHVLIVIDWILSTRYCEFFKPKDCMIKSPYRLQCVRCLGYSVAETSVKFRMITHFLTYIWWLLYLTMS